MTSQRLNRIKSSVSLLNVCLSHQRNTSPGETKLLASEIYEILQAAGNEEAERAEGEAASCKRKAHFFLGSSNKRAKTVVLHIDGLDDPVSVGHTHASFAPFSRATRPSQLGILIFGRGPTAVVIIVLSEWLKGVRLAQDGRVEGQVGNVSH